MLLETWRKKRVNTSLRSSPDGNFWVEEGHWDSNYKAYEACPEAVVQCSYNSTRAILRNKNKSYISHRKRFWLAKNLTSQSESKEMSYTWLLYCLFNRRGVASCWRLHSNSWGWMFWFTIWASSSYSLKRQKKEYKWHGTHISSHTTIQISINRQFDQLKIEIIIYIITSETVEIMGRHILQALETVENHQKMYRGR